MNSMNSDGKQEKHWWDILYKPQRTEMVVASIKNEKPVGGESSASAKIDNAAPAVAQATADSVVNINPAFERRVNDAIVGAKSLGYSEFIAVFSSLREDIPDEGSCFKIAIKTVGKTNKITLTQIIAAVAERQQILEQENENFQHDLEEEAKNKIGNKTIEVGDLDKQLSDKQLELSRLQKEIENLQQSREKAAKEINVITEKKKTRMAEFKLTYEDHKKGLTDLKEKLQQCNTTKKEGGK